MQRIAEKHQRGHAFGAGRGDLGRDASAHGFSADREPVAAELFVIAHGRDRGAVASFQFWVRIGSAAAVLDVGKIERDRIDAARRKPGREAHQERALLPRAGAVRQHQRDPRARPRVRRIDERAHALVGGDFDAKRLGHVLLGARRVGKSLPRKARMRNR